jgi:hypothetical protein
MVDAVVEVVPSVMARADGTDGMIFSADETPIARTMPGVAVHREVAAGLGGILSALMP